METGGVEPDVGPSARAPQDGQNRAESGRDDPQAAQGIGAVYGPPRGSSHPAEQDRPRRRVMWDHPAARIRPRPAPEPSPESP